MTPAVRERLPVLISRVAGSGSHHAHEALIRATLEPRYDVEVSYPASVSDLRATLGREIERATPLVAIGGGDGTVHRAINVVAGSPVGIAPLPLGSGNDFCRSLGLDTLSDALAAASAGALRTVDLLQVNGARVATVAGLGVVARSALQVTAWARPGSPGRQIVRALGSWSYLGVAGCRLLLEPQPLASARVRWRATAGGGWEAVSGRYYGIFLACRPTLGAGLRLPLEVPPDDGRFEIVLVEARPRVAIAFHLPRLRRGAHIPEGILTTRHAVEATIEWDGGTSIVGDGEDLGMAESIEVRLQAGALRVTAGT